jgi:hypothetical protein
MIRRPGELPSNKATACCLLPFSLPFIAIPLTFLYIIWFGEVQGGDLESIYAKLGISAFVSLFLLVGLVIFGAGVVNGLQFFGIGLKPLPESTGGSMTALEMLPGVPRPPKGRKPGLRGGIRLPSKTNTPGQAAAFMGFSLVWNFFIAFMGWQVIVVEEGKSWFAVAVLGVFGIIGLMLLSSGIFGMIRVFLTGSTHLELSTEPVVPGNPVSWSIYQQGNYPVRQVEVALVCREEVRYRVGTRTVTKDQEVFRQELVRQPGQADPNRPLVEGQLNIPSNASTSLSLPNNNLEWGMEVSLTIDRRPDNKIFIPFRVMPHSSGGFIPS